MASKRIKYVGEKEIKDMYVLKYKTLSKWIKEDLNKKKDICIHG